MFSTHFLATPVPQEFNSPDVDTLQGHQDSKVYIQGRIGSVLKVIEKNKEIKGRLDRKQ